MPVARFQMPDGRIGRFEVPDGTTPEQAQALISTQVVPKAPIQQVDHGTLKNVGMGALKGASDIGATLLRPVDAGLNALGVTDTSNEDRRASLKEFFQQNANPESWSFKGGELGADIAGTAGAGGALVKGARIASYAPKLASAIQSGGMNLIGAPASTFGGTLANAGTRVAGGAITGGTMAGMINPEDAGMGAAIGGAFPVAAKVGGEIGRGLKAGIWDPVMNKEGLAGAALLRSVGKDNVEQVVAALKQRAQTPGVRFSAGEASGDAALNAIEDTLRATNSGGALNSSAARNRAALANTLRGIAQDDSAVAAAKLARGNAVERLYTQAKAAAVPQDDALIELLKRPAVVQAAREAQINAANRGGSSIIGQTLDTGRPVSLGEAARPLPEAAYMDEVGGQVVEGGRGKSLLQEIRAMGGVPQSWMREISGETANKNARAPVGLFNKSARNLDDTASSLYEQGWIPEEEMGIDGGVQWLKDSIRQELDGTKVFALHDTPIRTPTMTIENTQRAGMNDVPHYSQNPGLPVYSGQSLHELKMALDAAKDFNAMGGANKAAAAGVSDAAKSYRSWLDARIPAYADAMKTFAEQSRPINQMQVGQTLAEKMIPAGSGDIPIRLNAQALARALRHPDTVAKSATGWKGAKFSQIMDPEQAAAILGVSSDASRIANAHALGAGYGSPTARRLGASEFIGQNFADQAPGMSAIAEALNAVPGVNFLTRGASGAGSMIGKGINAKIATKIEEMLAADPEGTAKLLAAALKSKSGGYMANSPQLQSILRAVPIAALNQANP